MQLVQLLLKLQVYLGVVGVSIREAYVQSKEQHPESQLPAENIHLFFKEKKILFMSQAKQQRDTVLQEEWLSGG